MLLSLSRYLEQTRAELERRRALTPVERMPALPKPKAPRRSYPDSNRALNRWIRSKHARAGVCDYLKCRGKNCPRKDI